MLAVQHISLFVCKKMIYSDGSVLGSCVRGGDGGIILENIFYHKS